MTFREAVEATPNLSGTFRDGLQALRAEDKPHIDVENTRKLSGSVDLMRRYNGLNQAPIVGTSLLLIAIRIARPR